MAMFSNISNAIKPPEVEDMATAQARAAQLRNMVQQGQMGALQLQGAERDFNDEKITRDAWNKSGGDPATFQRLIREGGGSPKAAQAFQTAQLGIEEKRSIIEKNKGQGKSADATAQEKHNTMVGDSLKAIQGLPPDERPEAYARAAKKFQDAGTWHAGDSLDYPGDAQLHQMTDAYLGAEKTARIAKEQQAMEVAAAEEARKAELHPAQVATANAEAATKTVLADQTKELGMTAQQKQTIDRQTAANEETARHNKREEGLAGGRLSIEQKRFNATLGAGLDANGRPLSTDEAKAEALKDPIAVRIASNMMLPPKSLTDKNGAGQAMMRKVLAINPDYDVVKAPARIKTEADFAPGGKVGSQITTSRIALGHLGRLERAGDALDSGNLQLLNKIAAEVGAQTGSSAPTVYKSILSMVSPEVNKAVIGEAGTVEDRRHMQANFDIGLSNKQRKDNIGAAKGLLAERVQKHAHAYETQMGRPLNLGLTPEEESVFGAGAQGGQGVQLPKGDGKVIDRATVEKFYQAAGGDPAKARKMATDAGWKLQ